MAAAIAADGGIAQGADGRATSSPTSPMAGSPSVYVIGYREHTRYERQAAPLMGLRRSAERGLGANVEGRTGATGGGRPGSSLAAASAKRRLLLENEHVWVSR